MTSILTNIGAMSALQTLRTISGQLEDAQRQVSTGMRVGQASDNAAYWSISATMRSDNMALSAVEDALGLGAAKVDTAYAGMTGAVDVLKEFKAKLVAATEEGVDRSKVQEELEQLKQQVVSISEASSFSGENWLRSDASVVPDKASVVSSFVRDSGGNVAVKRADIRLNDTMLFNAQGTGILQVGHTSSAGPTTPGGGTKDVGGLLTESVQGGPRREEYRVGFLGPVTFSPSDVVEFDVLIDSGPTYAGDLYHVTITYNDINAALGRSDGTVQDADDMMMVVYYLRTNKSIPISGGGWGTVADGPLGYDIGSRGENNGIESSILISNVTSTLPAGNTLGIAAATKSGTATYASDTLSFTGGFQLGLDEGFQFRLEVRGVIDETLTFSRSDVEAALGDPDGIVSSASDFANLLNSKTAPYGLKVTSSGSAINFDIDTVMHPEKGHKSWFRIGDSKITTGTSVPAPPYPGGGSGTVTDGDFLAIDVTSDHDVNDYLSRLETMLQDAISGAAVLGAMRSRIDMQSDFISNLTDSIDSGIGRLVDTDMNEASTRLKALQTQKQLATQSLSIANASADSILTLFR